MNEEVKREGLNQIVEEQETVDEIIVLTDEQIEEFSNNKGDDTSE